MATAARVPLSARVVAALLFFLVAAGGAAASGNIEELQDTTYKQLSGVKGQWAISVKATKTADKALLEPQTCDQPKPSAECNQPLLSADAKDKVQVTAALTAPPLRTIDNLTPLRVLVKACYAKPSTADRPWRKPSDVIDKDRSCPFTIVSRDLPLADNATQLVADWAVPKNATKAAWYAQVMVLCQNGTLLSFCQYDSTVNATYWATKVINSTPPSMVAATAVCSALGPLVLAGFFLKETLLGGRKK